MKTCKQNPEKLTLWVLGDLPGQELEALAAHVAGCLACQREVGEARALLDGLRALPVADPGEGFFASQAEAIASGILEEELREVPLPDPGEVFFHRQLRKIEAQIGVEAYPSRQPSWAERFWVTPLAVAAAIGFLVLGIYQIDRVERRVTPGEWQTALRFMAVEMAVENDLPEDFVEYDDLNPGQLDQLAGKMEQAMLNQVDESWVEEPADWDELNGNELDRLIRRLETKA